MRPITVTVGNLAIAANAIVLRTALTIGGPGPVNLNGAAVTNGIGLFSVDRNVLFTFAGAEPGLRLAIIGYNTRGQSVSELVTAPAGAGTVISINQYRKIISVIASQASVGAVSIGTVATGTSAWVAFDPWSPGTIAIQANVAGTANYTVQATLDNPNDVNSPIAGNPGAALWVNSSDTVAVGASTSIQSNFLFVPQYARILLNSGSGLVTATFVQSGAS